MEVIRFNRTLLGVCPFRSLITFFCLVKHAHQSESSRSHLPFVCAEKERKRAYWSVVQTSDRPNLRIFSSNGEQYTGHVIRWGTNRRSMTCNTNAHTWAFICHTPRRINDRIKWRERDIRFLYLMLLLCFFFRWVQLRACPLNINGSGASSFNRIDFWSIHISLTTMANLLRRVSHQDVKRPATLARSQTCDSELTKLEKRLPVVYRILLFLFRTSNVVKTTIL